MHGVHEIDIIYYTSLLEIVHIAYAKMTEVLRETEREKIEHFF